MMISATDSLQRLMMILIDFVDLDVIFTSGQKLGH